MKARAGNTYFPRQMDIEAFCKKWGFWEITTKRMTGRRFTNGKVIIGWTSSVEFYQNNMRPVECGWEVRALHKVVDMFYDNPDKFKKERVLFGYGTNSWDQHHEDRFKFMLDYLDQFPRKGMIK